MVISRPDGLPKDQNEEQSSDRLLEPEHTRVRSKINLTSAQLVSIHVHRLQKLSRLQEPFLCLVLLFESLFYS